jgi:hypothetical protein
MKEQSHAVSLSLGLLKGTATQDFLGTFLISEELNVARSKPLNIIIHFFKIITALKIFDTL